VQILGVSDTQERFVTALAQEPSVIGTVKGTPTQTRWSTRFRFDLVNPSGSIQVDLTGNARERWGVMLADGDTLEIRGPLDAIVRKRNPTDFDYGAFLFSRSIFGAVTISGSDAVASANDGPTRGLRPTIARLREQTLANVSLLANDRSAPVLRALLLDDRTGIDDELSEALSRAGLMHLLSVSGLHVMLVGFALYRTLFSLLVRLRVPW